MSNNNDSAPPPRPPRLFPPPLNGGVSNNGASGMPRLSSSANAWMSHPMTAPLIMQPNQMMLASQMPHMQPFHSGLCGPQVRTFGPYFGQGMNYCPIQAMPSYLQLPPPNLSPGVVCDGSSFASPNNGGSAVAISNDLSRSDADASPKARDGSPLDGQQPDKVGPPSGKVGSPSVLVGSPDEELMLPAEVPEFYKGNDSSPSDADASHKGQEGSPLDGQQTNKVGSPSCKVGSPSVLTVPVEGPEFYIGQIFPTEEAFDAAVEARVAGTNEKFGREKSSAKRVRRPDYKSILYRCKRGRFNKKRRLNEPCEKITTSYKCGCESLIRAVHKRSDDGLRQWVEVTCADLEHTNGCKGGEDVDVNKCIETRTGRKYDTNQLNHVRREVRAGRYKTDDVLSWLHDQGLRDVMRKEATNLRYRLLKDLPVRGWEYDEKKDAEYAMQQDVLYNADLAAEISAGGAESLSNLISLHRGLAAEEEGYAYEICTDSETRFSGTAWQTGRMRGRLKKSGAMLVMDDSRSGINTSGFCFWNLVVVDADGKVGTVMGAMTMSASSDAVKWVLQSLQKMSGLDLSNIITVLMSDLGIPEDAVKSVLPSVKLCAVCCWHIMAIDFPTNLKHMTGYEACKNYVRQHLVNNTVTKVKWENHLSDACLKWPEGATYLRTLATSKHRWGAPWRMEQFTLGMQASSVVEGSFSAFHRALDSTPRSFVGVIQAHVKKDRDKTGQERSRNVTSNIQLHNPLIQEHRNDAAKACAKVMSSHSTDKFDLVNRDAQNYIATPIAMSAEMTARGVSRVWSVSRRTNPSAQPRMVEEINCVMHCLCLEDINEGMPCRHIQCVSGGSFNHQQFHPHWQRITSVESCPVADPLILTVERIDFDNAPSKPSADHQGVFVQESAQQVDDDGLSRELAMKLQPKRLSKKKKPMSSTEMHNDIIDEGKLLAQTCSQEKVLYYKIKTLLSWLNVNVQNKDGVELKAAAASFMGFEVSNDYEIKPSTKKRTAGATATKRKKSGVEMATTSSAVQKPCTLCNKGGHNRANCEDSTDVGTRITKTVYTGKMNSVTLLDEVVSAVDVQTAVPHQILGLQVMGQTKVGELSVVCMCQVVDHGCTLREAKPCWYSRQTVDKWSSCGKSQAHNVWIKDQAYPMDFPQKVPTTAVYPKPSFGSPILPLPQETRLPLPPPSPHLNNGEDTVNEDILMQESLQPARGPLCNGTGLGVNKGEDVNVDDESVQNSLAEVPQSLDNAVDYAKMKVPDLRELLKSRKRKSSGKRAQLVDRLKSYDVFNRPIEVRGMGGYEMDNEVKEPSIHETIACGDHINFRFTQGPQDEHEDVYGGVVKQVRSGYKGTGYGGTLSVGFINKFGSDTLVLLPTLTSIRRTKYLKDNKCIDVPSDEGVWGDICDFEKLINGGEEAWREYMQKKSAYKKRAVNKAVDEKCNAILAKKGIDPRGVLNFGSKHRSIG